MTVTAKVSDLSKVETDDSPIVKSLFIKPFFFIISEHFDSKIERAMSDKKIESWSGDRMEIAASARFPRISRVRSPIPRSAKSPKRKEKSMTLVNYMRNRFQTNNTPDER